MNWRRLFFFSFFAGIGAGTIWSGGFLIAALFFLASLIFYFSHRSYYASNSKLLLPVAIFCLTFAFGLARAEWSRVNEDHGLDVSLNQKVALTGVISDEPDEREQKTRLTFSPDNSDAKIILITGKYPEHRYGERLEITGKLEAPENFETEAGRTFDYQNYLAKDEIYYLISQPKIKSLGPDDSFLVTARSKLFSFKNFFLSRLGASLPEPHASLLGGIVIGAKRGLPAEWQERFRTVGLSHIIVLSGYNITIVAEAVAKALSFLPMLAGVWSGAVAILLFTLATGASSTAIRATIMALVALLARASGRVYQSLDALFLAAFFMILFKPKILLFDLSFQLSFLATLGVIIGPPLLKKYFQKVPEKFGFREMLATTLSAQLIVLPWILYKMGNLSLVALPINLLVLGFMPVTMLLGLLTFIFSPFSYLVYLFLNYYLWLTKLFANLPFASVNISYFPLWLTGLVYFAYYKFYKNHE